jgi:hypothetical protein
MKKIFVFGLACVMLASFVFGGASQAQAGDSGSPSVIPAENKWALVCGSGIAGQWLQDKWKPNSGLDGYPFIMDWGSMYPRHYAMTITMRDILVQQFGFLPDHIILLTNESDTKANFINALKDLKTHDGPNSLFFMWTIEHGYMVHDAGSLIPGNGATVKNPVPGVDGYCNGVPETDAQNRMLRLTGNDPWDHILMFHDSIPGGPGKYENMVNFVTEDELKLLLDDLDFQARLVYFNLQCYGGGFGEGLKAPNRLIISPASGDLHQVCDSPHYSSILFSALKGGTVDVPAWCPYAASADVNNDGRVSVEEAYFWMTAAIAATPKGAWANPDFVYMWDGVPGETFL